MSRQEGSFKIGGTLEVLADAPADARTLVKTKAELLDANSFPYKYIGMIVSVASEQKAYMLIATDTTLEASWKEIGSGGGGGGTTIVQIPTVSVGTYTYNGQAQGPTITWSTGMSDNCIVTNATKTDAGTYTMTIALKNTATMVWADMTTVDRTYEYTIDKADQTVTLSSDSVTLDEEHLTATVTVNGAEGEISATSNDINTATVSVSDNVLTISNVNESYGNVTISVVVAGTNNYNAITSGLNISVSCDFGIIYGVTWDGSASSVFTRTDKAAEFTNPVPAVNNGNGSSPFDDISPWKDMVIVDNTSAGKVVSIPKFYYKRDITGSTYSLKISMAPLEGFSVSPAHRDRKDGKGERDVIYVARYHCASNYKSQAGSQPANNYTRAEFRTSIHNLGSDIWQWDYSVWQTIHMLYLVEFADWDSQKVIGKGCSANNAAFNMGATDNMTYHTGTDQASRDSYGCTQYRHIEGLWDNVYDWCDGFYITSRDHINIIDNPANFSDTSGGILVGYNIVYGGWIKAFRKSYTSGYDWFEYCWDAGGAEGSYVCDYCDYYSPGSAPSGVLYVGGYYSQGANRGLFYAVGGKTNSYKYSYIGSRLMILP